MLRSQCLKKLSLVAIMLFAAPSLSQAAFQDDSVPQESVERTLQDLERLLETRSDVAARNFIRSNISKSFRKSMTTDDLLKLIDDVRAKFGGFGGIGVQPHTQSGVQIMFEGCKGEGIPLLIDFDVHPPHKITNMRFGEKPKDYEKRNAPIEFTWNTLADQLKQAEKEGFSGTVLVVRGGKDLLHQGYGKANREENIPCTTKTIYAVGSTPIDFTRGAILKLEEMGLLKISDPITKFFDNVPDDKKTITIDHLMSGKSGLPNFHHIPGVDENYDLTWIDRDTAVKRIFAKELRFKPGEGHAHSHSAFGLLAAIIEIVSKQSYQDFLDQHFFKPIGMNSTAVYENTVKFNDDDVAVGYGGNKIGEVNKPRYWGRTSWLVMGSGGMVSTPEDLRKWTRAIWTGKTLSPESKKKYWSGGVLAGGNDRGFFTMYNEDKDTMFFLCSNSAGMDQGIAQRVAKGLVKLVRNR